MINAAGRFDSEKPKRGKHAAQATSFTEKGEIKKKGIAGMGSREGRKRAVREPDEKTRQTAPASVEARRVIRRKEREHPVPVWGTVP